MIKYATLPVMRRFLGSDEGLELKTLRRGAKPGGGGVCVFKCPTKLKLVPVNLTDPGKIKRVRGVAYAIRVSPSACQRMIERAKGVLLKLLPDVYIVTDHQRAASGESPAFGICLVAETTQGVFACGEACSLPKGTVKAEPSVPEDVGLRAAQNLLEEVYRGGCVDSSAQYLAYLFMVLNQKDVSRVLTGVLSSFSYTPLISLFFDPPRLNNKAYIDRVNFLRAIRDYFDTKFKIEPCRNQDVDINHKRALEEKEKAENERKQKKKRNLQLPQEIALDKEASANVEQADDEEEEERKRKQKLDDEEKEKSIREYLKLGHEKILLSCLGIGYTNITKTFI